MSTGKKGRTQGIFHLRHTSLNKTDGITIVEVLFVAAIVSLIIAGLFYALNTGEFSGTFSSAKGEIQAQVRRTLDWIVKDVRQTVSWDIADINNSPSPTHIKFRQVLGWDTVSETYLLSNNYIEYSFDSALNTIIRRLSDTSNTTLQTWKLSNIIQPPFYTKDSFGSVVPLNSSDLLTSRRLIIKIAGQKQVRGPINTTASLTTEVKIRNE